jgi:YVTN family beta-propeller protein
VKNFVSTFCALVTLLALAVPARADWVTATVVTGTNPYAVAVNPTTNKIYVANYGSASVTVVDGATNTTVVVATGTNPYAVAVNPVTNKIYVANYGSANVTVIDGATNTTTAVAAGTGPYAVAVNPVTNRIYVANYWSNNVTVIDGATNATATVAAGVNPYAVAVNPITNKIYVANYGSNSVTVIDGATNAITTVGVGSVPWGVAVNPVTNKIYVVNSQSNNVTVMDGATNGTTTVAVGARPYSVAVNPVTNKIYVANANSANVTVINGATNDTATVAAGTWPYAIAVNPVTNKIYVASYNSSANVTVIDGATNVTSTMVAGTDPRAVAVNPVTNKIYVPNYYGANLTVIDGCSNKPVNVAAGTGPVFAAVNPVSNKIYVVNQGSNNVTVVDGVTNGTATVAVGTGPQFAVVNPVTNKIYVTNNASKNVTIIDGTNNSTTSVAVDSAPGGAACNLVTNKIYVANNGSNTVTVINGNTNSTATVAVGTNPYGVAVNPVTNKIYVANQGSANVTVIDGATNGTTTVATGTTPAGIAVNPVTNKVYVSNYGSNNLSVIDGATNTVTATVATGSGPSSVAVNPVTNKIYVNNFWSANVTVINGATNTATAVGTGDRPHGVAVNPVTNKIYVDNWGSPYTVTIIDGATNTTTSVAAATQPCGIAVNPVTNKVYETGYHTATITVIDEAPVYDTGVRVVIDPLSGNVTYQTQPVISGKGVNRWSPSKTNMMGVINDYPDIHHAWNWAAGPFDSTSSDSTGWTYNWGTDSLLYGENYINIVPLEMQTAGTNNLGMGTPMAGNILTYPVYYLDNVPPSQVALVSPTDGWLTADSSLVLKFTWNKATDNYGMGEYRLQYASDTAFTQDLFDTTLSDTTLSRKVTIFSAAVHWRARAIDVAGNEGEYSAVRRFEIDPTAPEAPVLVVPLNGVFINDPAVVFSWSSVAKKSKSTVRYILQADTTATFTGSVITDTTDLLQDTLTLSPGIYWWRVMAFDLAGNQGVFSEVRSFEVDTTPPNVAVLITPADSLITNQGSNNFIWNSCTDSLSGLKEYTLQYAYNPGFAEGLAETTLTDTSITLSMADSSFYWRVEAEDNAGNSSYSAPRFLAVDRQPPSIVGLIAPANNAMVRGNLAAFVWNKGMDNYVVGQYRIQLAVNPFLPVYFDTTLSDTALLLNLSTSDTLYYWRVMAIDLAGNEGEYSEAWALQIDTLMPNAPVLSFPGDDLWLKDSAVVFIWSAVSKMAKASPVRYVLQVDTSSSFASPFLLTDTTAVTIDTVTVPQGRYYWRVYAFDLAGNDGDFSSSRRFGYDVTPPSEAVLTAPENNLTTNQSNIIFAWGSSADGVSGLRDYVLQRAYNDAFTHSLAETTLTDTSISLTLADSSYYWRVVAADSAGNSICSAARFLVVDTQNPDVPGLIAPYSNNWIDSTSIVFAWTEVAKKSKGAAVEYVIQLDTVNTFTIPMIADTTASLLDTFSLSEGQYYWRVMAYDLAGNYGIYSDYREFGIDTTAPLFQSVKSLPDDQSAPYGPYEVTSKVYDLSGVKSSWLFTQVNGGTWDSTAMFFALDSLRDSIPQLSPATDETLSVGYYIKAVDMLDHQSVSSTCSFKAIGPLGVAGNPSSSLPAVYALNGAYPNPSRGNTIFKYQLPKNSPVKLEIYNVAGQLIKSFEQGTRPAGYHQINWNGNAANGVYIYRLRAGNFMASGKVILLR